MWNVKYFGTKVNVYLHFGNGVVPGADVDEGHGRCEAGLFQLADQVVPHVEELHARAVNVQPAVARQLRDLGHSPCDRNGGTRVSQDSLKGHILKYCHTYG